MILKHSRIFSLIILLLSAQLTWAVEPSTNLATYYTNIDGKSTDDNDNLRKALCTIISEGYTSIAYNNLKDNMYAASSNPTDFCESGGTMEDIYSSKAYVSGDAGSSANTCGTGWNKEHTVPQSWFGEATPMKSDAHHVFPTDIRMNSVRSSYPYGENNASKECSSYGYGHLGNSTFSGYTGTVFDPGDGGANGSYKGDLARVYFYMVTRYRTTNFTSGTGSTSFTYSNNVADLTDYMKNLMLKWHREDPVSEKELKRNNAIYAHQHNRNPFVDYPCLVEYIWGERKGESVVLANLTSGYEGVGSECCSAASTDPTIISPASTVEIGSTSAGDAIPKNITIKGKNLTSDLTFTKGGEDPDLFTISAGSMTQADATSGTAITVTYSPTSAGSHSATLTISGGGLTSDYEVTLTGTCCSSYDVTLSRNGITEVVSCCGTYTLPTTEADACDGWEFKGWTTSDNYSSATAPSYVTSVSSSTTLYAVYAKSIGGSSSTKTYTFNIAASNFVSSSYADNNNEKTSTATASGADDISVKWTSYQVMNQSGAMQWQKSKGYIYNSTDLGAITGITITSSAGTFTTYYGTSEQPSTSTTVGNGYFKINVGSATGTVSNIEVTFQKTVTSGGTTTYKTNPCATYTITYAHTDGIADHGTYSASATAATAGTVISLDAEPEDCYELSNWNVTQNGGVGTVTVTDNSFTMPEYNVIVTPTFSALPQRTATFMNGSSDFGSATGCVGEEISISNPTACEGYTFVGWSTATQATEATSKPSTTTPTTIPAENTTYHAVYSRTEEGSGSTTNVTASSNLVSGTTTSGYTFATAKNGGSSDPTYSGTGGDVRLYAKNQITISASSSITQIVFNVSTQGKKRLAPITASAGTIATQNSGDETVTWTGSATSITFTVGDNANYGSDGSSKAGQLCFSSVDITSGGSSSTTYYTTSPDCCTGQKTITVEYDNTMGTVSIE